MFTHSDLEEAISDDLEFRNQLSSEATNNLDTPVMGLDIEDLEVIKIDDQGASEAEVTLSGRWSGQLAGSSWEAMDVANDVTARIKATQDDDGKFHFEVLSVDPKSPIEGED